MKSIKCVTQSHRCAEIVPIMEDFRFVVNEAVRLGIENNITSRFKLRNLIYPKFNKTMYTGYVGAAVFRASTMVKNYKKASRKKPDAKVPFMKRNMLAIDNQRYTIIHNHIKFPVRSRQFVYLPLNHHICSVLSHPGVKLGQVILTDDKLCISYSKDITTSEPSGYSGIDMNLENATVMDRDGNQTVIDMSGIVSTKMKYRKVMSHFRRNDFRIRKKINLKYGMKQRNKENTLLHQESKKIALSGAQIIMENLRGIRKLYRKGNGQGKKFRFRLNSWSRFKLQRMINYKSIDNNGFPILFVRPDGTSSKCAACGCKLIPEEHRMMRCLTCHSMTDRDVNASRNVLARGLVMLGKTIPTRFEPDAVQGEAMKQSKDVEQIAPSLLMACAISRQDQK